MKTYKVEIYLEGKGVWNQQGKDLEYSEAQWLKRKLEAEGHKARIV